MEFRLYIIIKKIFFNFLKIKKKIHTRHKYDADNSTAMVCKLKVCYGTKKKSLEHCLPRVCRLKPVLHQTRHNARHISVAPQCGRLYTGYYSSERRPPLQLQILNCTQCQSTAVELQADVQSTIRLNCMFVISLYYFGQTQTHAQPPTNYSGKMTQEQT